MEATCAVCLEAFAEAEAARLPCCVIPPTSTTRFCRRCIELICERSTAGVGRCPNCRAYLRLAASGELQLSARTEACACCGQIRAVVETAGGRALLCDACLHGVRRPLLYECERCRRFQRIPHPMYRYQRTPDEFSSDTWACHVRCAAQTRWRIKPSELCRVAAEDAPEGWGLHAQWLEAIRAQRRQERGEGGAAAAAAAGPQVAFRRELKLLVGLACALFVSWIRR